MHELSKKIIVVCFLFFFKNSFSDSWIRKADYGGVGIENGIAFSIANKGYVGTGEWNSQKQKDFWQYDPLTDSWTQMADFAGLARDFAVGFSIGDKGYIGTGLSTHNEKDFWEFDSADNIWTRKADFPGEARYAGVGFSIGDKGYIGLGTNGSSSYPGGLKEYNDFFEYNPINDVWTKRADYPEISSPGRATAFTIGSRGYVQMGLTNDFLSYDPSINTWNHEADFPGSVRDVAAGFSICNKGFMGTGWYSGTDFFCDFWEYDQTQNSWTLKSIFPGGSREGLCGFSIGKMGYLGTGVRITDFIFYRDFWEYNPDTLSMLCIDSTESMDTSIVKPAIPNLLFALSNDQWKITNLPENTFVVLFNSIGQLVFSSSNYQNNLYAHDLSSGLYTYRVSTVTHLELKGKLVVIR
jgi:N-acetylneuraminic acid mutarotase